MKELGRRLIKKEGLPEFKPVTLNRPMLMAEGRSQNSLLVHYMNTANRVLIKKSNVTHGYVQESAWFVNKIW